jgi:SAM-dependent methyltransferase
MKLRRTDTAAEYGSFHRYYDGDGTAGSRRASDHRLDVLRAALVDDDLRVNMLLPWLSKNGERETVSVLDIGCNDGTLTFQIAALLRSVVPPSVSIDCVGIDVDSKLIEKAVGQLESNDEALTSGGDSMSLVHGDFLMDDCSLGTRKFDVIMCFSVTKWIHLNAGDEGVQTFFRNVYERLKPRGSFWLEPQTRNCYRCRGLVSEHHRAMLQGIRLWPSSFPDLLVSPSVGFSAHRTLYGAPSDAPFVPFPADAAVKKKRGRVWRPIHAFRKV